MEDILGSKSNPYTSADYHEMCQSHNWNGGWVRYDSGKIVYITANGSVEQNNDDGELGSEGNPFSEIAYDEMMVAGTWPGGYVRFGSDIAYLFSFEDLMASGIGSCSGSGIHFGSGYGVGCGVCYVQFGHEIIATAHNGKVRIVLSWNSGYTQGTPLSFLCVHAYLESPFKEKTNTLVARWYNGSVAEIMGSLEYTEGSSQTIQVLRPSSFYNVPSSNM